MVAKTKLLGGQAGDQFLFLVANFNIQSPRRPFWSIKLSPAIKKFCIKLPVYPQVLHLFCTFFILVQKKFRLAPLTSFHPIFEIYTPSFQLCSWIRPCMLYQHLSINMIQDCFWPLLHMFIMFIGNLHNFPLMLFLAPLTHV